MAVESSEIQRGEYLPRVADGLLTQALQSSGAVQIKGPKWCGKTATAERQSASQVFMQDPDRSATLLALADTKPSLILRGEEPRLIDEWQMAPQLWDAVRFAIDRGRGRGRFILTGSATPQQEPRIQFVSATLVFGLAAFDCSLAISSSHTSLGVL